MNKRIVICLLRSLQSHPHAHSKPVLNQFKQYNLAIVTYTIACAWSFQPTLADCNKDGDFTSNYGCFIFTSGHFTEAKKQLQKAVYIKHEDGSHMPK